MNGLDACVAWIIRHVIDGLAFELRIGAMHGSFNWTKGHGHNVLALLILLHIP